MFDSIPDWYKTQKEWDRVINKDPFMLVYYPDRYKTQRICNEVVDDCLGALKFINDWYVTSKMLGKFHDALLADSDTLFWQKV